LDRSDILDIGNKNIVLYRIEFMPAIHRPTVAVMSVHPSSNLLNLSSEIDVVDNKYSSRKGLWSKVTQGHFGKFKITQSIFKRKI
jgi:hypothetical protein